MNTHKIYNEFLERSLITDSQSLINVVEGFPYHFKVIELENILLITNTIKSENYILYNDHFNQYKSLLENLIINKLNYEEFFYFGKNRKQIDTTKLFSNLHNDIKLDKHIFYKHNHNIKYYLYFANNKWCISSEGKLDIYTLENKSFFENYTLYELLLQVFYFNKIKINDFNRNYNYILTLNTKETFLTLLDDSNVQLELYSMIDKITNEEVKLNRLILDKLKINVKIPVRLYFNDLFHLKKDIYLSNNQRMIVKNIETSEEYILNYHKFNELYILLDNFIKNPVKNVFELIQNRLLNTFISNFPSFNFFITNLIVVFENKVDYLFKKYIEIYIKKKTMVYQPYDKELLLKIHTIFQRFERKITKLDVQHVLFQLKTEKINKIMLINYNLNPLIPFNPMIQ